MSLVINECCESPGTTPVWRPRSSSQIISGPKLTVPRHTFPLVSTTEASETSSSETDNSENSRCPFLNKEHLPELKLLREHLRTFFRQKNRMEQLLKKPWIFIIQALKLLLITVMLVTLTDNNYGIKTAVNEIKDSISNLLIEDYESLAARGKVYSFTQLENITEHAVSEYICLSDKAISLLGYPNGMSPNYPPPVQIYIEHYAEVSIKEDWSVDMNDTILLETLTLHCPLCDSSCVQANRERISARGVRSGLLRYSLRFPLQLLLIGYLSKPHCVHMVYELAFENELETGLELQTIMDYDFMHCNSTTENLADDTVYFTYVALDFAVMAVTILSSVSIVMKILHSFRLYRQTSRFIFNTYRRQLNRREKLLFVNYWYICILLADTFLLVAAVLRLLIDLGVRYDFDSCTLTLGLGVWLSYLGILRYLVFNKHYSMLLNTITVALPHLARFMVCVIIVSLAYIFCGWLILSPYNSKFATFWVTMETLFSLLNGDDMYATFDLVKTHAWIPTQHLIQIFSRIYLYSYVCFFIYVVLSLCISIIEDAYMVVSNFRSDSLPWVQDPGVLPEMATSWEVNCASRRRSSVSKGRSGSANRIIHAQQH